MINIADLPAVRAQLAQDVAAVGQPLAAEPVISLQEQGFAGLQPEQTPPYPSKNLVLVGGRYHAVNQEK